MKKNSRGVSKKAKRGSGSIRLAEDASVKNDFKEVDIDKLQTTDTAHFAGGTRKQLKPMGSSGTELQGGYFSEEYLRTLRGRRGAKKFDEMRRSEPQVAMLLNAIMNAIKSGTWEVEAAKDVPNGEVHAAFIEDVRTKQINWESHLHEALTFFIFGYSVFEIVHKVYFDHPKFGTVIGLKGLGFRSQKTIDRWIVSDDTGDLVAVEQEVQGDTGSGVKRMDANFLLVMSLNKEGDNYEGIGVCRPMYGPYFRKSLYQTVLAMGVEQNAKGTIVGTTPAGLDEDDEQVENFKTILQNYVAHESAYIIKPAGWEVTVESHDFDPEKLASVIKDENVEMINSVCANFLALGTNGGGGSFALGSDLSDFMLNGIKCVADIPRGVWNRVLIPMLIKMNFGEQEAYPELKVSNIDDKAGKELAEIMTSLVSSKILTPDDKLETSTRKRYNLPEADPTTARKTAPPTPFGEDPNNPTDDKDEDVEANPDVDNEERKQFSERRLKLSASYPKLWRDNKKVLKEVMTEGLEYLLQSYIDELKKQWASATDAQKPSLALKLQPKGLNDYRNLLRENLANVATQGIKRAKEQMPWLKKSKIKLAEQVESLKLAAPKGGFYDALPPKLKRIIKAQADLIAETQNSDISKMVSFQYGSSLDQDNINQIVADIEATAKPVLEGATSKGMSIDAAAGNAVSSAFSQARTEMFFDAEVLETLESMTYVNADPISEICQALVGVTLSINDPLLDTYATPLHHNCDGEWVPNEKGAKGNPEIKRGGVPLTQKALDSITLCECRVHTF